MHTIKSLSAAILLALWGSHVGAKDLDIKAEAARFSAQALPAQLVCEGSDYVAQPGKALEQAMALYKLVPGKTDTAWFNRVLKQYGSPISPVSPATVSPAVLRTIALLHHNLIAAGKVSHEAAKDEDARYALSDLAGFVSRYINTSLEPLPEGEEEAGEASKLLRKILARTRVAKDTLGPLWQQAPLRYYVFAHALDDGLAVRATGNVLCAAHLEPLTMGKVSAAADLAKFRVAKPKKYSEKKDDREIH